MNKLNFILLKGLGKAFVTSDVPKDALRDVLKLLISEHVLVLGPERAFPLIHAPRELSPDPR